MPRMLRRRHRSNANAASLATLTAEVTAATNAINEFYDDVVADNAAPPPVDTDADDDGVPDPVMPSATQTMAAQDRCWRVPTTLLAGRASRRTWPAGLRTPTGTTNTYQMITDANNNTNTNTTQTDTNQQQNPPPVVQQAPPSGEQPILIKPPTCMLCHGSGLISCDISFSELSESQQYQISCWRVPKLVHLRLCDRFYRCLKPKQVTVLDRIAASGEDHFRS